MAPRGAALLLSLAFAIMGQLTPLPLPRMFLIQVAPKETLGSAFPT
jgi:hypothetical protein